MRVAGNATSVRHHFPATHTPRARRRLKSLRRLSLAHNDLAELPPSFRAPLRGTTRTLAVPLTSRPRRPAAMLDLLAYLRLERNPRLTLRGVGSAGGLSALESLTLSDTGVDAVPAEAPRRLLTFAQRRCGLVAVLPDVFTRWERIRDLDLRYGRGAGVRATHGTPLSRILPPAASTSCSRSPPRSATSPAYARCTSGTTSCRSCRTSCASAGR